MFGLRFLRQVTTTILRPGKRGFALGPAPPSSSSLPPSSAADAAAGLRQPPGALRGLGTLLRRLSRGAAPLATGVGALALAPTPASAASFSTAAASGGGIIAAFKSMGLPAYLLLSLGINWLGWALAAALKTEKFYDLTGSLTFTTVTATSLALGGPITPRKILLSAMVGLWTLRLGSYLVARIHKQGKDSRFDEVKHQPGMFFVYWSMQALWVWITLSPVLIVNTSAAAAPLVWTDAFGAAIWAGGLLLESVADRQKDVWRSKPENKGKFITEGLWSVSRHPNYLGEILIWWGVFGTCINSFTSWPHAASVASPLFVTFILNYLSGVPILERQADQRWGELPEYKQYKARTPVLVPWNLFTKEKQNGHQYQPVDGGGTQEGQQSGRQ